MKRETNIPLGLLYGIGMAVLYSLYVSILYVVEGNQPFQAYGISFGIVVILYFLGGIVGGVLLGMLLPWTSRRSGSAVVGIIVACPFAIAAGLAVFGPLLDWGFDEWFGTGMVGILLGGWGGYYFWKPVRTEGRDSRRP